MPQYASPVDTETFGEYARPADAPGREPFTGRIASEEFPVQPGRFHLYAGWFCPWAHRVTLSRALNGLEDYVSLSWIDNARDARGWAFREGTGEDPINGFTLLRQAYEAGRPGYDGHVSVPLLWDKVAGTVVSNDLETLALDFPAAFDAVIDPEASTAPPALRPAIAEVERELRLTHTGPERWNELLGGKEFVLGDRLTEADIYLWVKLIRHDLDDAAWPELAAYRDRLLALPAFAATTDRSTY
jgi:glutathionyl-hydroquinone reductase